MNKEETKNKLFKLTPARIIALSFTALVFIGAFLLCIPASSNNSEWLSFTDALFTSASAVSVTGLIVADTAVQFSVFGQIIILLLIQIGGLGIMTVTILVFFVIKRRLTLRDRMLMQSAFNETGAHLGKIVRNMLIVCFITEFAGAILLLPVFIPDYGAGGIFKALFISVSSFCNAGFDIMGTAEAPFVSLSGYASNILLILTVSFLMILGSIGFAVFNDFFTAKRFKKLSVHSKLVLITTLSLIIGGFIVFALTEIPYASDNNLSLWEHLMNSFFHSAAARSGGFVTINIDEMSAAGRLVTMFLMMIGSSPGSTGGGLKTTTLALIVLMIISGLKGRNRVIVFKKQIPGDLILKLISAAGILLAVMFSVIFILLITESNSDVYRYGLYSIEHITYLGIAAVGNVGMDLGLAPHLSIAGKYVLTAAMLIGRVGALSVGLLFVSRQNNSGLEYPEANIIIG